jgi:hypothetical protein
MKRIAPDAARRAGAAACARKNAARGPASKVAFQSSAVVRRAVIRGRGVDRHVGTGERRHLFYGEKGESLRGVRLESSAFVPPFLSNLGLFGVLSSAPK